MLHNEGSLALTVVSANDMPDVEKMGKQDPYTQLTLHLDDKKSWQKTSVQKDVGKNAHWNQNFEFVLTGEPELYVEVMDEEKGVDEVIGFCAIPINQVVQAPGGYFNGLFGLFLVNGKSAGTIHMILTARGFNSPPGGNQQQQLQPVQGRSHISEEHLKRVKNMRHKAFAGDIGTAVLGGALAVGAGFVGNKFYKDREKKQQEEQEQKEQYEQEKQQFEQDKEKFEREKAEAEAQRRRQEETKQRAELERRHQQEQQHHHDDDEGRGGHQHHHHHEHRHSSGRGGTRDWDPVGTYAAGDRVQYHGRDYICLQGHTSNPTWQPGAAHSLWQPA